MNHRLLLLFTATLLLTACGGSYNTEFAPPTGEEKYSDIVPSEISGEAMRAVRLELDPDTYHGARFEFGEKASILMIQSGNETALDAYFKETVVPQMEEGYGSKMSGKINGRWSARASGQSGRFKAWQNGAYIFVIKASTDEIFEEIVEKFPYIAKK